MAGGVPGEDVTATTDGVGGTWVENPCCDKACVPIFHRLGDLARSRAYVIRPNSFHNVYMSIVTVRHCPRQLYALSLLITCLIVTVGM